MRAESGAIEILGAALIAGFLRMSAGAIPSNRWDLWMAGYLLACVTHVMLLARLASRGWRPPPGLLFLGLPLVVRLAVLDSPPGLTTDLARYRADALGWLTGHSPYWSPALPVPGLEHAALSTIYPPLAELGFVIAQRAGGSDLAFRSLFGLLDLVGFLGLVRWLDVLGRARGLAWIWGLCPLTVLEFAGVGHVDSLAIALTVWALACHAERRWLVAGLLLGAATLAKLAPAALLPILLTAGGSRLLVGFLLPLLPVAAGFAAAGPPEVTGLFAYATRWEFNGLVYGLLTRAGFGAGESRLACLAAAAAIALHVYRLDAPVSTRVARLVYSALLLTPTLHNWYIAWAVPLLAVEPCTPFLVLVSAGGLSYGVLVDRTLRGVWAEGSWWWLETGALVLALGLDRIVSRPAGTGDGCGKLERESSCPED